MTTGDNLPIDAGRIVSSPPSASEGGRGVGSAEQEITGWTVHLLKRDPARAPVVATAAAFCGLVGWMLFSSPLAALAGVFMIFSATSDYLLPSRYRLTNRAAYAASGFSRFEIEWAKVKRVIRCADGVRLSPLAKPSRMDAYRGVFLRLADYQTREQLLRTVESHCPSLTAGAPERLNA